MSASYVLIQALNGIQYGLLLFLVASGLTLIFGIMGVINLAHGAFYMVGAYFAWWFAVATGSFLLGLALAIPAAVALGLVIERLGIARLYRRDHLYQVLFTYGLILILNELQRLVFGSDVYAVPVPGWLAGSFPLTETQSYPYYRVFLSLAALATAALLHQFVARTRLGMVIRAGSTDPEMVSAMGFDVARLFMIVFALGTGLAAFAGMLYAPVGTVFPGMGDQILILSFVVVVIGGIGSLRGAFVGAMLIGLAETFGQVLLPGGGSGVLPYAVMALVLVWAPQGLFGRTA
jgi:branched-chain amino acid transport system permease protein